MSKKHAAIALGKAIFYSSRILKQGGGYAAPGLYSLKLDPDLVAKLINHQAKNIVITGTNGKTTTSKLLSHFLENSGFKVIRNSSGSNLERGVASHLVKQVNLFGKINYDYGIWELDEFAFNSVAPKIKPDIIVLLNAFRDQLDRYGEVDTVVKKWKETLQRLGPETTLVANSDDGNVLKAVSDFKGKIIKIGIKDFKITGESSKNAKVKADIEAEILKSSDLETTQFKVGGGDFKLPLPGIFNVYNFLASYTALKSLNLDTKNLSGLLSDFTPAFGRLEKFELEGKEGRIFLIKNPVGASEVLKTVLPHITEKDCLLLALNDNFADGTDVSWIWDIGMENLKTQMSNLKIIVSGTRAYDLALRLKYAGVNEENIEIVENLQTAFNKAVFSTKGKLFILPTYTALMELQKIMVSKGIKKEYWRE